MKRPIVLLITLCLAVSWGLMPVQAEGVKPEGKPWVNSDLFGRWPSERPAPEDQYELWANFDYDLFFRTYAGYYNWYFKDRDAYFNMYSNEVHPFPFFRVNFTVQNMDEFYETYPSVVEGTPMYLRPEEREVLW